jgi:hypothetical protein
MVNASWDAALPSDIEKDWRDSRRKMINLNSLAVNRSIVGDDEIADNQLHGFSDSSAIACSTCLYLSVVNVNDKCTTTNLICPKSRVSAPLKTDTTATRIITRSHGLLARIASKYAPSLRLPIKKTHFIGLTRWSFWHGYHHSRPNGKHS